MKIKSLLSLFIICFGILISTFIISVAIAQNESSVSDIKYPVSELGNCKDETACRAYCDKPQNSAACIAFAERHNLMPKEEIEMAKKFIAAGNGPGGCTTKEACEEYCSDFNNIDECISFAEQHNMIPKNELEDAKKVKSALAKGVKPPPCVGKAKCDEYCSDSSHMEECITFAEAAGLINENELGEAKKALAAVKKGVKPPPCRGKNACDAYCGEPDHMEECMAFAMAAGFMNEQEAKDAEKMLVALKKGVKPPSCRGKEECDVYCAEETHFDECMNFAEAAGFMSGEELEMVRKTRGKGPGDCRGKEQCEAFCNNPDNQETCFSFAKEHGLIPEEDLRKMEEGKRGFLDALNQAPAQVMECLAASVGSEVLEKFKSGVVMPSREVGDKMRECFEKTMGQPQVGPGGCKTPEECKAFCETNPDACKEFMPGAQGGQEMPMMQQGGPGGCKSPDECMQYCSDPAHLEECQKFIPQGDQMSDHGEYKEMMDKGKEMMEKGQEMMKQSRPGMMSPEDRSAETMMPREMRPENIPDYYQQMQQMQQMRQMPEMSPGGPQIPQYGDQQQHPSLPSGQPVNNFQPSSGEMQPPAGNFQAPQQPLQQPQQFQPQQPSQPAPGSSAPSESLLGLIWRSLKHLFGR